MTYHTHWTGEILDLDLGNPATRTPGEGIFWNPDTGKYESDTRTHAIGDYVDGTLYNQGEELFDGSNLSEAKRNDVTSYPYVTPFGEAIYVYEGAGMANAPQDASQIIFGNRYTSTEPYYLDGYRVFVTAGHSYQIKVVVDPDGAPEAQDLLTFTAGSTGWLNLNINPVPVRPNTTFDLMATVSKKPAVPVQVIAEYDYLAPQNATIPLPGQLIQGRSQKDLMGISYTDNNGGDQTAMLQGLGIGDTIESASGGEWAVQANSDQGTWAQITISPATVANIGVMDFTFLTTIETPIPVPVDPAYWPTTTINAQGIIAVDLPYGGAQYNTNAYGIDILVQDAYIPPAEDWWLKVIGDGSSGAASARVLTRLQQDWVVANTQIVSPNDVVTTDDTWTEVFRGMVETDKGFKAVLSTDSKRLDATGYYAALRTFLAYDVAGVVTIIPGNINELGDNLDVRAIVDGTDVVIEVQGKNGQEWSWTTTTEYKEID